MSLDLLKLLDASFREPHSIPLAAGARWGSKYFFFGALRSTPAAELRKCRQAQAVWVCHSWQYGGRSICRRVNLALVGCGCQDKSHSHHSHGSKAGSFWKQSVPGRIDSTRIVRFLIFSFGSSMKKTAPAKRVITLIAGHGSQNSRRLNSPGKWRKGGRCTAQTR
jgi:hypothetical protein